MHKSSMLRMQWFKENYLDNSGRKEPINVLDVGSQCVSGQSMTYKTIFTSPGQITNCNYAGLDMAAGYNVDIVVKTPYRWTEVMDDSYDVVISGQLFEHVEFPWLTISEMARVLKPGGLVCIIAPSMCHYHAYPLNCQNYFSDGLIALAKYVGLETLHASTNLAPEGAKKGWYEHWTQDSMLVARKPLDWKSDTFEVENYTLEIHDSQKMATGMIPREDQKWYRADRIRRRVLRMIASPYWLLQAIFGKIPSH